MLRTLSLAKLAPWALLAWAASLAGVGFVAHGRGYDAAQTEYEGRGWKILAEQVRRAAAAGEDIAAIGRSLQVALAESTAREPEARATVRRVTDAHPDFAAVRRPAELQRLRDDQLERISRAAAGD